MSEPRVIPEDIETCPHCLGTGTVKRRHAVKPWRSWTDRVVLSVSAKPGDRWLQIKSGRVAIVARNDESHSGSIYLQHENGRTTGKWRQYFGQEYTPETPPEAS